MWPLLAAPDVTQIKIRFRSTSTTGDTRDGSVVPLHAHPGCVPHLENRRSDGVLPNEQAAVKSHPSASGAILAGLGVLASPYSRCLRYALRRTPGAFASQRVSWTKAASSPYRRRRPISA